MKDTDYYLSLPYTIELQREDETTWFARVRELPGCMTEGDSLAEAAEMLQDAMAAWIDTALEDGKPVPEPRPDADYSGKFVVRVSRSLHRDLVDAADREGVSLNQFIATELARAVGRPSTVVRAAPPAADWPGLQEGMKATLVGTGFREDAATLDEHRSAE